MESKGPELCRTKTEYKECLFSHSRSKEDFEVTTEQHVIPKIDHFGHKSSVIKLESSIWEDVI